MRFKVPMGRFLFATCMLLVLLLPANVFADTTSLQSVLFNVNGTQYADYSAPGMNVGAWDQLTGLGTLTFLFNSGPGSYFFDVFFDHQLNSTFRNEYGTVHGSAAAGQSWEIGDRFASNIKSDVQAGGTLNNTNSLPGQASNFSGACGGGATCNGDFAAALGFSFVLGANQEALITLNLSHTNPGGFNLQATHPVDGATPAQLDLYISGSAVTRAITANAVPEPNSVVLLGVASALLLVTKRHGLAKFIRANA